MLIKMFKSVSKHFSGDSKNGTKVEKTQKIIVNGKTILDKKEESHIPISNNMNSTLPFKKAKKTISNNNHIIDHTNAKKKENTKKKANIEDKTKTTKLNKRTKNVKEKKKMSN